MSEFLRDLLNKAKESADGLESPPEKVEDQVLTQESEESGPDILTEPGLVDKPDLRADGKGEPGSHTKPSLPDESDSRTKPGLPDEPGLSTKSVRKSRSKTKPGLHTKPGLPGEPQHLQALRSFATSQHDLHALIPNMKPSELRLYHYLIEQTYGNPDSSGDHVAEYSQRQAMQASGIKSTATIVKAMSVLVKRRLVKWVRRSRKRGQSSLVKVFLPDEPSTNKGHSQT